MESPPVRIAVTGGVAEGKSTVMATLAALGVSTASADQFVAEAYDDPEMSSKIAAVLELGPSFTKSDVSSVLEASSAARRRLNSLLHPWVADRLVASEARVVEVPLLIEAVMTDVFDVTWVVTCGRDEQLRRLRRRGLSADSAGAVLGWQLPTEVKIAFADAVVRTNAPSASVSSHVAELAREFRLVG